MRLGSLRFFLKIDHIALMIEFHHAIALRIMHMVSEYAGALSTLHCIG